MGANTPEPSPVWAKAQSRRRRWFWLIGALGAFVLGVIATGGFLGSLKFAETTNFCIGCHEMTAPYDEYRQSVHYSNPLGIRAGCGDCHVPKTFLAGLWRHVQAVTEVEGHLEGKLDTPAKYEAHRSEMAEAIWAEFRANNSAECRSCHSPAAMALEKQPPMAAQAHGSLKQSGMTCIDCHQGVAHRTPPGT